jgi:enoyl-CoA hydratase/carnithine racemase
MAETVLVERAGSIATVVLNAPEKLNALDMTTWRRLGEVMRELSADDSVRCVVLRGAGNKAFAAGADIGEFATVRKDSKVSKVYGELVAATMQAVMDCRHPTVALIKGACVGGGLEVAACCDLRICGESSRFGVPINKLGLVMAYGELAKLLALAGRAVTLEILLEGRVFGAAEAKEKGLVTRVVPDGKVEEETYATARRIAEGAPLVARWHKKFVRRLLDSKPLSEAERDEGFACYDTEDFKIGVAAFLAKKKPEFKGR